MKRTISPNELNITVFQLYMYNFAECVKVADETISCIHIILTHISQVYCPQNSCFTESILIYISLQRVAKQSMDNNASFDRGDDV